MVSWFRASVITPRTGPLCAVKVLQCNLNFNHVQYVVKVAHLNLESNIKEPSLFAYNRIVGYFILTEL